MAKLKSVFVCQQCGQEFPRWAGQCGNCSAWNSLVEEVKEKEPTAGLQRQATPSEVITFPEVERVRRPKARFSTGISELDRVLGGQNNELGMVAGAVMLIGGEPGIGKSTLLTQVALHAVEYGTAPLTKKATGRVLYVAGEESPSQIALRISRIIDSESKKTKGNPAEKAKKPSQGVMEHLLFTTSTDVDRVIQTIKTEKPSLVIIDSIQTMTTTDLTGTAGSVGQIRETAERLTQVAKELDIPLFLVGHVTKEGELAGPKVLEHIVDSVLEMRGERTSELRILRAIKNRFGATDEVGVFKMTEFGFISVDNPAEYFLEHRNIPTVGSATVCVMEGTRPLLLEVQALVVPSQLAMPRRVGRGVDLSKIQIIAAVLQKYSRMPLSSYDLFVSVAGGFVTKEPSIDLGIALAIASSLSNSPLPPQTAAIGEVGLLGEIRSVTLAERRLKEAKRLGMKNIISKQSHSTVAAALIQFGLQYKPKKRNVLVAEDEDFD
ncbi:MAG: DNA repair protein RadA [Candidatus Pacebacteria bacterium CG_4_10_14_0_8_um_filter_43_12]|nr:MAG: DNA repair protein RadA [Candidatus Pacebacteria bacterium CG10_big_fil_rev_8_21_14_0_10_44_11]PIY79276.1 MAG: DNA repair protein RadA [Candidatus Pacebacteria bacterium CG_4_10_14_0_8_um_filter_43_12]